jgi:CheY-like chemotaxis protein
MPKGGDSAMVAESRYPYELLVADDDEDFRATVCAVLEPFFHTIEVSCGEEAILVAQNRLIHVALIDLHMHALSGLETLQRIREFDARLPCILITSDASDDVRQRAADLRAWSVIRKPPGRLELVDTVAEALSKTYDDLVLAG